MRRGELTPGALAYLDRFLHQDPSLPLSEQRCPTEYGRP